MTSKILTTTGILALATLLASAEEGRVSGPVSGFVFDTTGRSVRPLMGVPGAGYLGEAVALQVDAAASAPNGNQTLYVKDDGLYLVLGSGAAAETSLVSEGVRGATRIVWSADSSAAAIYNAASGALNLWKQQDGSLSTLARLPGSPVAIAAADLGSHAITAIQEAGASGIYLVRRDEVRLLASAEKPSAIAVAGHDLFFADRARGEVWTLRHYLDASELAIAAHSEDVAGIAVNRGLLLVTSAGKRTASAFKLGSGELVFDLPLDFTPSGLQPLSDLTWMLNAGGAGPLQVLVVSDNPSVYFVPGQ